MTEPSLRFLRSLFKPLEDIDIGKKSSPFKYAKMKVLPSHKATEINDLAMKTLKRIIDYHR